MFQTRSFVGAYGGDGARILGTGVFARYSQADDWEQSAKSTLVARKIEQRHWDCALRKTDLITKVNGMHIGSGDDMTHVLNELQRQEELRSERMDQRKKQASKASTPKACPSNFHAASDLQHRSIYVTVVRSRHKLDLPLRKAGRKMSQLAKALFMAQLTCDPGQDAAELQEDILKGLSEAINGLLEKAVNETIPQTTAEKAPKRERPRVKKFAADRVRDLWSHKREVMHDNRPRLAFGGGDMIGEMVADRVRETLMHAWVTHFEDDLVGTLASAARTPNEAAAGKELGEAATKKDEEESVANRFVRRHKDAVVRVKIDAPIYGGCAVGTTCAHDAPILEGVMPLSAPAGQPKSAPVPLAFPGVREDQHDERAFRKLRRENTPKKNEDDWKIYKIILTRDPLSECNRGDSVDGPLLEPLSCKNDD